MTDTPPSILYRGMEWAAVRGQAHRAVSDTTGGTYIVEPDATGRLWTARFGFPERVGKPFIRVGQFADDDTARIVAERHDFQFWSNAIGRTGGTAMFLGSGHGNSFMGEVSPDAAEDIGTMMAEAVDTQNSRIFAQAASFFTAQKTGLKQERNGTMTLTLSIAAGGMPRWLLEAAPGTETLCGALETASAPANDWQERGQRALRRSFSLPSDSTFQHWILHRYDRWRLVATAVAGGTSDQVEEATTETLRRLIACPTRKTLARDRDAIERLETLDREFYMDMTRGFGAVVGG